MLDIYSIFDIHWFIQLIRFIIAFYLTVYIPGFLIVQKLQFPPRVIVKTFLAVAVGLALWSSIAFVLGLTNLRFLSYIYLGVILIISLPVQKSALLNLKLVLSTLFKDKVLLATLLLGSALQLSVIFPSGLRNTQGVTFYQINAHDGMFHVSLIDSLVENIPPDQPGAIGMPVTNYHYWSDMLIADIVRVWRLPIVHTYFQYIPLLLAPLLGLSVYAFIELLTNSKLAKRWGIFLHYFSGGLMYIFMFLFHRSLNMSSITFDNGAIQFINMPQAMAKILFFAGLILIISWTKYRKPHHFFIACFLFSLLVGFKVYYGIFAGIGLISLFIYIIIQQMRQQKKALLVLQSLRSSYKIEIISLSLFAIISSFIFFPTNSEAGGLFFAPLTWPKLLIGVEKLDWRDWWLRMQVYEAHSNIRNMVILNSAAVLVYMVAVFGVKNIGFLLPFTRLRKLIGTPFLIFTYPASLLSLFIGMNMLQVSGGHNVFNFTIVTLNMMTVYTALMLAHFFKTSQVITKLFTIIVIGITVPSTLYTSYKFTESVVINTDATTINNHEIDAYTFVSSTLNPKATIQSHINNAWDREAPYTPFFTRRKTYFTGSNILKSHNQPIEQRESIVKQLSFANNSYQAAKIMHQQNIAILYLQKNYSHQKPFYPRNSFNMKVIFENDMALILQPVPENQLVPATKYQEVYRPWW